MSVVKPKFLFAVLLSLVLFSCKEEEDPFYFANKGVIHGRVYVQDNVENPKDTKVILKGANFAETFITNETGEFRFENVPTSNCELEFVRENFGLIKTYNIRQSGIDTIRIADPNTTTLYKIPQYEPPQIFAIDVALYADGVLSIDIQASSDEYGKARVFLGTTPEVSYLKYTETELFNFGPGTVRVLPYDYLDFRKRWPGATKLYVVIYSDGGGMFFDPLKDRWIFSAMNVEKATSVYEIPLP
jgi:hypothetical protein